MAVNGRFHGITRRDLLEVGDRFVVPDAAGVVETVLEAVARWRTFAEEASIPGETAEHIADDIERRSGPLRS
jgi:serine/threonine-protein kinase HipA